MGGERVRLKRGGEWGLFGRVSLNDDLKNGPVNKWSGSKQGSALHQKSPFICEQESVFSLWSLRKHHTDTKRTVLV